jgi:hypothetical protein
MEEAEKRDHRKIGRSLISSIMQEEAPGMVFWHPNGWTIYQVLEQYMRKVQQDNGYVRSSHPAGGGSRAVGAFRSLGQLQRQHVHHRWSEESRVMRSSP